MNEITREEFGIALFDCIKLFAGRNHVREEIRQLDEKELPPHIREQRLQTLRDRELELEDSIAEQIVLLSPEEQREVLQRYEGV